MKVLLPIFYLPPISWFSEFLKQDQEISLEMFEHFPKQTYRNRVNIYAANGKLSLIIPIVNKGKRAIKEVEISYAEDWQKLHWKSIKNAYQSSPYFEYYEAKLYKIYECNASNLTEFNLNALKIILEILKVDKEFVFSDFYQKDFQGKDLREAFSAKKQNNDMFPEYYQTFSGKWGFISDLSIIDLLCNMGPESITYFKKIN